MGGGASASAMKLVFVLVNSLILQANANGGGNGVTAVAREWCKRTRMNDLCVSIIDADPRTQLKSSPNGLCVIVRDRAVAEAAAAKKATLHYLNINKINNTFNHYAVQCLQSCANDDYEETIHDLNAIDFTVINSDTYVSQSPHIGGGYIGAQSCEESFTERAGTTPSPLTAQNQAIKDVCDVLGSILDLVVCNQTISCQYSPSRNRLI